MPLKVLTISKPYVGKAYRDKLAALAREPDLKVGLVCPDIWGNQKFEPGNDPFPIWRLPIVLNGKNHFHWYRHLAWAIDEFKPDVLNVEEEHYSFVTWQCFRLAKTRSIPAVFYTWQNIFKRYPPPFCWIESSIFKYASAGICGNQEAADILHKKGYRGPTPVIPQMGIDLERFEPKDKSDAARLQKKTDLGLDPQATWIGFFGRVVEEKGLDTVVDAMTDLPRETKFLVVGGGPYLAMLKARAKSRGVDDRLTTRVQVSSDAVPDYLQAIDIMCLPSRTRSNWKEQFGRILVEAMAAGAVVVGSDSGEIPTVIGDCGVVFPEGNPKALAKAILDLNPDVRTKYRDAALSKVKSLYTNSRIAQSFASVFRDIASTKAAK